MDRGSGIAEGPEEKRRAVARGGCRYNQWILPPRERLETPGGEMGRTEQPQPRRCRVRTSSEESPGDKKLQVADPKIA